jgi:hypothetical protein
VVWWQAGGQGVVEGSIEARHAVSITELPVSSLIPGLCRCLVVGMHSSFLGG